MCMCVFYVSCRKFQFLKALHFLLLFETFVIHVFSQWDLVCDDQWKVPFASSTLFVGYLVGSLISGQLSDRYFIYQ